MSFSCQCCGTTSLVEVEAFRALPRVTSDSKPFPAGGQLFVCDRCGLTQKIASAIWLSEIEGIYSTYDMYHQSGSYDQVVFDSVTGKAAGRCEVIAGHLHRWGHLASVGNLLDVGTGNGAMVAAFSANFPAWNLYGQDQDTRKVEVLAGLPGFKRLFTGPITQIDRAFDLVTLVHALEHFTEPVRMLREMRQSLSASGRLFVEVNNTEMMSFDLVVADHLCHFTPSSLEAMMQMAGLDVQVLATQWIKKELSLIALPVDASRSQQTLGQRANALADPQAAIAQVTAQVNWLQNLVNEGNRLARTGAIGIFGTSVAATWLAGALGENIAFFVDEDPARSGRTHMGRPVYQPTDAPKGALVYLAFITSVAQLIAQRLHGTGLRFAMPNSTL